MRTTLVTGATGFVGSQLVDELLARGESVRGLVRDPAKAARLRERGVEVIVGDIRDPDAVSRAVQGIDVVHHCAAAVGAHYTGREIRETNLGGVRRLLEQRERQAFAGWCCSVRSTCWGLSTWTRRPRICPAGGRTIRPRT